MIHNFKQKLAFSIDDRSQLDMAILKAKFHGCVSVDKTDVTMDKTGVDYVVTLRDGAQINVDAKAREKGASKFWKHGEPELALEIWSVMPRDGRPGKPGWTVSESTNVDYILYTFDPSDTMSAYVFPFQAIRNAFIQNYKEWTQKYLVKKQRSERPDGVAWESEAVFVPASVVLMATGDWQRVDVTKFVRGIQQKKLLHRSCAMAYAMRSPI